MLRTMAMVLKLCKVTLVGIVPSSRRSGPKEEARFYVLSDRLHRHPVIKTDKPSLKSRSVSGLRFTLRLINTDTVTYMHIYIYRFFFFLKFFFLFFFAFASFLLFFFFSFFVKLPRRRSLIGSKRLKTKDDRTRLVND